METPIPHYKVRNQIFIDYMEAVEFCDRNNISYSEIVKTKKNIISIEELQKKHEELKNILIKYNCEEHGDAIIDEICFIFDYPQTIIYYKED